MIIEVDTNFLVSNNLSSKQYLFLYLLYRKAHYQLLKYLKKDPADIDFIQKLKEENWLIGNNINNLTELNVTSKFSLLFSEKDYFQELLDTFPKDVIRQDGSKVYLRTSQKECKRRYVRIIKNSRIKHDSIITALKAEIKIRKKEDKVKWFKTLPNWLKAEEWKIYEGINEDAIELGNNSNKYGSNIL